MRTIVEAAGKADSSPCTSAIDCYVRLMHIEPMKLQTWMDANGHDDKSFGALVGRDRSQIYRIRNGHSRPSDALKVTIAEKTAGAVPLDEWFGVATQDEAA